MALTFKKATKTEAKLRLALIGTSGSGKTFTALTFATALAPTGKIAVIDTERGSASKYADKFSFDALDLDTFAPAKYVEAIAAAQAAGYEVLVIDSLSHAWSGKDGALEMVDKAAKRSQSGNSFTAWRDVTPEHNRMIDAIVGANMHVIVTLRAKTEYVMEANSHGKLTPRKIGLAPVQRDGMEYEFDVVGTMNDENTLVISKTRCSDLSGGVYEKPNGKVTDALKTWLTGAKPEPKAEQNKTNVITWELALKSWQFQKERAIKHGGLDVQIERCKPHKDAATNKDIQAVLNAAECLGKVVDAAIGVPEPPEPADDSFSNAAYMLK